MREQLVTRLLPVLAEGGYRRVAVAAASLGSYWLAVRFGHLHWLPANLMTVAAFTPVQYVVGHTWSFSPAREARHRPSAGVHRHRRARAISVPGLLAVACVMAAIWAIIHWPAGQLLVYAASMMPVGELTLPLVPGDHLVLPGMR